MELGSISYIYTQRRGCIAGHGQETQRLDQLSAVFSRHVVGTCRVHVFVRGAGYSCQRGVQVKLRILLHTSVSSSTVAFMDMIKVGPRDGVYRQAIMTAQCLHQGQLRYR